MKEEINKNIKILKNKQFETNSSISQIKTSIKSWLREWSKLKTEYE
jgi:hypothetical protein